MYPLCIQAAGTKTLYQANEGLDVSIVIDQEGIVRYRGAGVDVANIKSTIDNLIETSSIIENNLVKNYRLDQNYPNPFNPSTTMPFEILKNDKVSLKVYDNQGRFIRSLLDNTIHAGRHTVKWNGRNDQGESVSAGVYFYTLKTSDFTQTRKMILIR